MNKYPYCCYGKCGGKGNTLRIFLMRHGETNWNHRGVYQGHKDIPLNGTGRRQALAAAQKIRGESFDHVYSSDLKRARETATILLSRVRSGMVTYLPGLRELDFGEWEGLTFPEVKSRYPVRARLLLTNPEQVIPPGGEGVLSLQARVVKTWRRIVRENHRGTVLIVSHGGPLRILLDHWLGHGKTAYWGISLPHCSVSFASFAGRGNYPQILVHNI